MTLPEGFLNTEQATVTTASIVTTTQATINVPSTAALTSGFQYRILVDTGPNTSYERMIVAIQDGTTLEVIARGEEGTRAQIFPTGARVRFVLTAASVQRAHEAESNAAYDPIGSASAAQTAAESFATGADATVLASANSQAASDASAAQAAATTAAETYADTNKLAKGANLSDVASASAARSNLGLGTAATQNTGAFDAAGAASAAQAAAATDATNKANAAQAAAEAASDAAGSAATAQGNSEAYADSTKLAKSANLSDLTSPSSARTNLGLGTAAVQNTGAFDASGAAATAQTNAETYAAAQASAAQAAAEAASDPSGSATTAQTAAQAYSDSNKLAKGANLSDLASATAARTNLGLGSAATQASSAFDSAGAASAAQAAAEAYADSIAAGLSAKTTAKCLGDANISLSGLQTLDTYTLVDGDRVLLTNQTSGLQNGLWLAHAGAWTRPSDFPTGSNAAGVYVFIEGGAQYRSTGWIEAQTGPVTVDTTSEAWKQFVGLPEISTTQPIIKTGNSLALAYDGTTINKSGSGYLEVVPGVFDAAGAAAAAQAASDPSGSANTAQTNAENYADTNKLAKSANLSDVASAATARTNLGLGTAATHPAGDFDASGAAASAQSAAEAASDPSGSATTAQSNAEAYADTNKLAKSANLSDVASPSTARTNLGLGTAATHAAGDFDASGAAAAAQSAAEAASDPSGAATTAQTNAESYADTNKLAKASNLSDLASASSARTNLGLGTAATQASSAFDASGAAIAAQSAAVSTAEAYTDAQITSRVTGQFTVGFNGGGTPLSAPMTQDIQVPFGGTLTGWTLLSDVADTISVHVWKAAYASYPPTSGNTITGGTDPSLTAAAKNTTTTLSGWTTAFSSGDCLRFTLAAATVATRVILTLQFTRS